MKMIKNEIELCGLLWDTENLTIGGYAKDGHHYYTWHEAMEAARSVGKRLPTPGGMDGIMRSRLDLGR